MFRFKKCDKRKQWALKSAFADLCSKEIPHAPLEMMEYLEAHGTVQTARTIYLLRKASANG